MKSDIARDLGGKAFWPRIVDFKQITAQLLPTGLAIFVMIAAGMVVQYYLKRFGPAAVAAYGVALRVEQLFLLPVFGLTGALLPIAAQNFGAGFATRTRKALFDCWIFGWIFMLVMCPILWVAAPTLMQVFTNDADVVDIGVSYLRIDGMLLPAYMMLFAVNSFLQALRKPGWTLWIGLYRQAFGVAFFVWIFVNHFGLGVLGVWYGIAASVLTGLVLSLIIVQKVCKPLIGSLFWGRKASAPDGTQ